MSFEPALSLTEQIADHLGGEIITGRLKPLSRIQELKVAGDLGVSRGSVREALLILERRHLIEIIPRRGAVVSCLEAQEIANFSELFTQLQISLFSKLACQRSIELQGFECALEVMAAAVAQGDKEKLLEARKEFLLAGFQLLDNFYLCSVLKGLIPAGLRLAYLVALHPGYEARDTLRYHHALLDALAAHDDIRVAELVMAYSGRERKLALGCSEAPVARRRA
jgi:DNA-binding GntR family transcriptional regulator